MGKETKNTMNIDQGGPELEVTMTTHKPWVLDLYHNIVFQEVYLAKLLDLRDWRLSTFSKLHRKKHQI